MQNSESHSQLRTRYAERVRLMLLVGIALSVVSPSVGAQGDTVCTYDQCALMLRAGFWGTRLLQGVREEPIARIWFLAPRVSVFTMRTDTASVLYESFRRKYNGGAWLQVAGLGLLLGASLLADESEAAAIGLVGSGVVLTVAGVLRAASGRHDLSRALWWYNRGLLR